MKTKQILLLICPVFLFLSKCTNNQSHQANVSSEDNWIMHNISKDYLIANSLNPADINKDGYDDYSVIDEYLGNQTFILFPSSGDPKDKWERVDLGKANNPEYSCLGDLDNDGEIDLVVVSGDDLEKGFKTGVRIFWNPGLGVKQTNKWIDAGFIKSSIGKQYLYAEIHDIDSDGYNDILVGGRRNAITNEYAGLKWIKAPANQNDRRDLSKWKSFYIDKDAYSAHGFVVEDVNDDGHKDILLANADWDTPAFEEDICWYQNPGNKAGILQEWEKHIIWKSSVFYPKPQIDVGDINNDGMNDLCTQTQNFIHLFIKTKSDPVEWKRIDVKKPKEIQWIGRPIKFADINNDGNLDVVGMLIHNDGYIPKEKYSVFWMEYNGKTVSDDWSVHKIKQSDGFNTYNQWRGEKWDHCLIKDMDNDGDKDIIGNVEENYFYDVKNEEPRSHYSIVWFENCIK